MPPRAVLRLLCAGLLLTARRTNTLAEQILRDGQFASNLTQLNDVYSWSGLDWRVGALDYCPAPATRGLVVTSMYAELGWPGLYQRGHGAGVYSFECLAQVSRSYPNDTAAFILTIYDGTGEIIQQVAEMPSAFRDEWQVVYFGAVVSRPAHSIILRVGNGSRIGGGHGRAQPQRFELLATMMQLNYEPVSSLPSLNEGMFVEGPDGLNGKSVQFVTDGTYDETSADNWQITAFGDRMVKEIALDFGAVTTVCGTRLRQPIGSLYAKEWSLFVSDNPTEGWTKWIEAVDPISAAGQAVSDGSYDCSRLSGSDPDGPFPHPCVRTHAIAGASEELRPCLAARHMKLRLERPEGCCYLLLEWQLLGIAAPPHCDPPCRNGGRCSVVAAPEPEPAPDYGGDGAPAAASNVPAPPPLPSAALQVNSWEAADNEEYVSDGVSTISNTLPTYCECPVDYGWTGTDCTTGICTGGCSNGGKCTGADFCSCPFGFYGSGPPQNIDGVVTGGCREARCGDGGWVPWLEKCDDGNTMNGDGCSEYCRLEDPRLDAYATGRRLTTLGDYIEEESFWEFEGRYYVNHTIKMQWDILFPSKIPSGLILQPNTYVPTSDFWRLVSSCVCIACGGNIVFCLVYGSREFKPFKPKD